MKDFRAIFPRNTGQTESQEGTWMRDFDGDYEIILQFWNAGKSVIPYAYARDAKCSIIMYKVY